MKEKGFLVVGIILAVILSVVIFSQINQGPDIDETSKYTISKSELIEMLKNKGINPTWCSISSEQYNLVSKRWILKDVSSKYDKFLKLNNLDVYIDDKNMCIAFSTNFVNVSFDYYKNKIDSQSVPAIGMYWHGMHSLNIMVVLDSKFKKQIVFYEPQLQYFVRLTEDDFYNSINIEFY